MNEVVQILDNIVATKNAFTVDNATFLASAITATLVTMISLADELTDEIGSCGKTKKECNNLKAFDSKNQCIDCD